jgi:glycerophosphoryl diester phosphodiesterase
MYWILIVLLIVLALFFLKKSLLPKASAPWLRTIPVAHRGYFDNASGIPENSLLAFKRALERAYAIELDVHLSSNGEVIVFHDYTLERMTGATGELKNFTLKDLEKLRLLKTNEPIPTLAAVLSLVAGQAPLYIELKTEKSPVGPLEEKVYALLKDYQGPVCVLSFNPLSLAWFRHKAPTILRGQNYYFPEKPKAPLWRVAQALGQSHPHAVVYNHQAPHDTRALILLKPLSPLLSYTIRTAADEESARRYAHNIIFENLIK